MVGRVKARKQPLEVRSWATQRGRTRRDSAIAQPGSTDSGWERANK
jgi:hypothetical protein